MESYFEWPHDPVDVPVEVLLIGSFDGVHQGHRHLIALAKKEAANKKLALITFQNHPNTILNKPTPAQLCSSAQRLKYFEELGVDLCFCLAFTQEMAQLSAYEFLKLVKTKLGFKKLLRGQGSTLGHNREGDEQRLKSIANDLDFEVAFIPLEANVSSTRIREALASAKMEEVEKLLERPFSFEAYYEGASFKIADDQALPPPGTYAASLLTKEGQKPAQLILTGRALELEQVSSLEAGSYQVVIHKALELTACS